MFVDMRKRESELEYPNQNELSLDGDGVAREIRLTNGRCFELPENPSYPLLVKLFLQDNSYLTDIPPSFFEHMPHLEILDMSNTNIRTLPMSVSKLLKLQKLLLKHCKLLTNLPSEIDSLTNLRVLDLEETKLICLPKQIGSLHQLECLRFSLYKYADQRKEGIVISRETLSKLSSLKELSIQVDPECKWWDVEVKAIIYDLYKLGNLKIVKLYLPTHQLFQNFLEIKRLKKGVMTLLYPTLSNFRLIIGRHEDPIMSCVPRVLQEEFMKMDKCLKYVNLGENLDAKVLQHASALFVHRHWRISALSQINLTKMDNLKFCLLAECDTMKTIIDCDQLGYHKRNSFLGSLYYLGIHYMKNLLSIWNGKVYNVCFSNLKILSIHTCPQLTTIFNNGFFEDLIFLQELVIKDCLKLSSLVNPDHGFGKEDLLPSLRKISLLHLPELVDISRGKHIASNLEVLVIYNCPKLNSVHPLEVCSKNVKMIKGESKWWECKKSGWSIEQHDYLVSVFVPVKVDDDCDELAGDVQISLTSPSQATERNDDLIVSEDMEMADNPAEHPKEKLPVQATERNEDLIVKMTDYPAEQPKEKLPVQMYVQPGLASVSKKTLVWVDVLDISYNMLLSRFSLAFGGRGGKRDVLGLPDITVGWDELLKKLKEIKVSVYLLYGPSGTGKTTLSNMLCKDVDVKDTIASKICFVAVSQKDSLKDVVHMILQHFGKLICVFQNDEDMMNQLQSLLRRLVETRPYCLYFLDDAQPEWDSFIEKFYFE